MPKDTLSITDNRTGKSYELKVQDGCIKTADLRQIRVDDQDFGLMGYDPTFLNTANTRSAITFLDGLNTASGKIFSRPARASVTDN